jgi:hypothetical protein
MWDALGYHNIAATFSATNLYANDVAAIPSLHAAYPLMIALLYWGVCRPAARIVMALYVAIMALTLVYTAEHYVVDILLAALRRRHGVRDATPLAGDRARSGPARLLAFRRAEDREGAAVLHESDHVRE